MKNKMSNNRTTKDTVILFMVLFYPAVSNYIWRVLVGITGLFGVIITNALFDAVIWTIVVGVAILTSKKRVISVKTLMISLMFVLVALLSFALTDYEYFSANVLFTLIFGTFSFFIQGSFIDIKKVSREHLKIAANIVLCISVLYSLYLVNLKGVSFEDNMSFAYKVLPSVLIVISNLFTNKKNKIDIIFSIIGVLFLVFQGTRGPLLCLAVFIFLMLFKKYGLSKTFLGIALIILLATFILGSTFIKTSLLKLTENIDKSGYSSRIITMMIEGELSQDNGRDALKDFLLDDLKENPFAIRGIFADREATRGLVVGVHSVRYTNGTYAHSLWVEMLYDWGILLGGIILIWLVCAILSIIKRSHNDDAFIIMIFICTGIVHLFVSGSYLQSSHFFFLLGLLLNYSTDIKIKSRRMLV